jgi:hypothetical protein
VTKNDFGHASARRPRVHTDEINDSGVFFQLV